MSENVELSLKHQLSIFGINDYTNKNYFEDLTTEETSVHLPIPEFGYMVKITGTQHQNSYLNMNFNVDTVQSYETILNFNCFILFSFDVLQITHLLFIVDMIPMDY